MARLHLIIFLNVTFKNSEFYLQTFNFMHIKKNCMLVRKN